MEPTDYDTTLAVASERARQWLRSLDTRPVAPTATADELLAAFGRPLPDHGQSPELVVAELATIAEPGLMAIPSGRFFGWVMGGTLPAALGADWLVSAWDQNAGMRYATPAVVAAEEAAAAWLLDLLALPSSAGVGFVTGATAANFTCLAAARHTVLDRVGWDVEQRGLTGAPAVRVFVGEEAHVSVDLALRYLGLGAPVRVRCDTQGRLDVGALAAALGEQPAGGPVIVCLQAGNLHSGAFDDIASVVAVARAHDAWVHVDGAFGLWAAASPSLRHLLAGVAAADSWATDAHKTLNVPYDCGLAIVADVAALHASFSAHTSYLISAEIGDPLDRVPEMSRRARGVPVWAALKSLGRVGVAELIARLTANAQALAAELGELEGVSVLNDVVYTQVCLTFGSETRTQAVTAALIAEGTVWMSGSHWRGQSVLRVSVSNWSTDDQDIARSVDAVRAAMSAADSLS